MNRHWAITVDFLPATRFGTGGSLRAWRRCRHHAQEFWGDPTTWPKYLASTRPGLLRHHCEKTVPANGGDSIAQHMTRSAQSASKSPPIFARTGNMRMRLPVPTIAFNWSTVAAPAPRCCRLRGSASSSASVARTCDNCLWRPQPRHSCGWRDFLQVRARQPWAWSLRSKVFP